MLFKHGLKVAYIYNVDGWNRGKGWRKFLKPEYAFFDKILFSKIRENFGGQLDFFIGGGALLDIDLQRFFMLSAFLCFRVMVFRKLRLSFRPTA